MLELEREQVRAGVCTPRGQQQVWPEPVDGARGVHDQGACLGSTWGLGLAGGNGAACWPSLGGRQRKRPSVTWFWGKGIG